MPDHSQELATRRRGRPRAKEPTCAISTRLPVPEYDQVIALSKRHDIPPATMIRRVLIAVLRLESQERRG